MLLHAWKAASRLGLALARLPRKATVALGAAENDMNARPLRLWQTMGVVLPIATAVIDSSFAR